MYSTDDAARVFDAYCHRVIKNAATDYYKQLNTRRHHEVYLNTDLLVNEDYLSAPTVFTVWGYDILLYDAALITALQTLPRDRLLIVLTTVCLDLDDIIVSRATGIPRRTVSYLRTVSLARLREVLCRD